MLNSFVLTSRYEKERFVLSVAKLLLVSRLITEVDGRTEQYDFWQYMECSPAMHNMNEEMGCVCPRWRPTD